MSIVPTNIPYNYMLMSQNIKDLKRKYDFFKIENAGYSVLRKNISVIKLRKWSN